MSTRTKASLNDSLKEENSDTVAVNDVEDQGQKEETIEEASPWVTLTPEQEKKLWRKVDVRILPILTVMYLCAFMDKANIGNAKLQGLASQLDLTGHKYNLVLMAFFAPLALSGAFTNLLLKKFRPSRWLPAVIIVSGITMTLTGLVKSYPQLIGTRIVLGIAEAGLFPGAIYYMTLWYPRYMLQYRIAIFESGSTLAGACSGLFAYGISFMSGTAGLLGWSWIFILEGILSLVVGLMACFILVDLPDTAKFLTKEERAFIVWKKSFSARTTTNGKNDKNPLEYDNSLVGEDERFEMRHLVAGVLDWQVWALMVLNISVAASLYGISLFLPSIIHGFGYNTAISQLLTVPPYVCGVITLVVFAISSDKLKIRSPFIFAALLMCLAGFAINISDATIGVKYFGTFLCVSGSYAALPGDFAWIGNNLAGQCKRAVGMGLLGSLGNFGAVLASNVYLSQDAPYYKFGHKIELIVVGVGLVSVPLIALAYRQINKRRDDKQLELEKRGIQSTVEELRRMGDRAPDFRYTL